MKCESVNLTIYISYHDSSLTDQGKVKKKIAVQLTVSEKYVITLPVLPYTAV